MSIEHVEGSVDPIRDLDIISNELRQKDIEILHIKVRKWCVCVCVCLSVFVCVLASDVRFCVTHWASGRVLGGGPEEARVAIQRPAAESGAPGACHSTPAFHFPSQRACGQSLSLLPPLRTCWIWRIHLALGNLNHATRDSLPRSRHTTIATKRTKDHPPLRLTHHQNSKFKIETVAGVPRNPRKDRRVGPGGAIEERHGRPRAALQRRAGRGDTDVRPAHREARRVPRQRRKGVGGLCVCVCVCVCVCACVCVAWEERTAQPSLSITDFFFILFIFVLVPTRGGSSAFHRSERVAFRTDCRPVCGYLSPTL